MLEFYVGEIAEQHGGEMGAGPGPERAVVELAGVLPGGVDELLDGMKRRGQRHQQHVLRGADQNDGIEICDRIEIPARLERHVHREALRAEMQRIAVGRRFRRRRGPDIAAAARTVLDEDILSPGSVSFCARMRPSVSMVPPAGNAITMRTGSVGIVLRPRRRQRRERNEEAGHDCE